MGTQAPAQRRIGTRFFLVFVLPLGLMGLAMAVPGGWALMPRLAWVAVLGLLPVAFWPVAPRRLRWLWPTATTWRAP